MFSLNIFSFFSKNKIKTTSIKNYPYVQHWLTIFDKNISSEFLQKRMLKAGEMGVEQHFIARGTALISDEIIQVLVYKNKILRGFPYFKSAQYEQCETREIIKTPHTYGLEALIRVKHFSGCALTFFATDYALNKDIYQSTKDITVNITGLAYVIQLFESSVGSESSKAAAESDISKDSQLSDDFCLPKSAKDLQFADDFCGYFPDEAPDDISFVGKIKKIKTCSLGEVAGHIITVGITSDLNMDFFIAQINLNMELSVGQHICGVAWIQGAIKK